MSPKIASSAAAMNGPTNIPSRNVPPSSDMARERLGEEMRGGVGRHCAIQDAEVAMRLHLLASAE